MTEKELREQGWKEDRDSTWSHPDTDQKRLVIRTDSGDHLWKELGRDDVYKK